MMPAPPTVPPAPWGHVALHDWQDWRWQLKHRLHSLHDLGELLKLTQEEKDALSAGGLFRIDLTPYLASLIDPDDPNCPIRKQVVPTTQEMVPFAGEQVDSLAEEAHAVVPGLVHRYPDRVLMLTTTHCASYCRFCTRSRIVGNPAETFGPQDYARQLAYIAAHPEVRDVLLSGGDPLTLPQDVLEGLLFRLRQIPHVEIIRIGTRVPFFLPQRVTAELVEMLRRYHPLWINVHLNHPKELAPEVEGALARLADVGIPLGSQTVLMAGINDCPRVMTALMHKLVRNRVRPYYLYQCDLVHGAGHFRTPVAKGIEIMEALRGHTSGYAVPTFVIDAPGGGGKVPLSPNYLLSMSESRVVVRNFEGFMSAYVQPESYQPHDASSCHYCQREKMPRPSVRSLLSGNQDTLEPEGWHAAQLEGTKLADHPKEP